jgi:hypothetical protein
MVLIDGTFMQQLIDVLVKVKLDEKNSMIGGCKIYCFKSQNLNGYNDTSRATKGSGAKLT